MHVPALRLGVVGGGLDSAIGLTHRIASQMDGRFRVEAGCFSTDGEINTQSARSWGVSDNRLYPSWQDLVRSEKGDLDAIAVLTPTPSHAEIVVHCVREGYPVLCEKALATSSAEAGRIRRALEERSGFLAVFYNYTGYAMLRELRLMIQDGRFGKLCHVQIEMPQEGFLRLNEKGEPQVPQAWRLTDSDVPTISLDLGVHLVHMLRFLSGETPIKVAATQSTYGCFRQVVDNVACIARYTGGLSACIWYSKSALGHRNGLRVRVYGSEGSAEWLQIRPEVITCADNRGAQFAIDRASGGVRVAAQPRYNRFKAGHPAGFIEAFANHYYDIADALLEFQAKGEHTSPWVFSVDEALEGLRLLEAIAASARAEAWEDVGAG